MDDKIFDQIHDVDLKKTMEKSYIDYAMSVIASRALPDVRDGLKPVQRRVLYSMIELNNGPDKPHRKCARIVGDTMGKYHPHGDSSIYGALVNMAQDWSTRYPLVDGHGNFGSVDGDGAAAMRYTEARLSKISMEMLADINKNTVDFQPNFDETEKEPVVLPSRYPNLLVNGTTGIAVGMATNIPPHNLREVINAVVKIIDNRVEEDRDTTIEEILEVVKGPDFPTGGMILGTAGIEEAYRTGRGKIRVRAVTDIEPMQNGKNRIVVTELPYMVNKARLIEKIAELVKDKRVDGITDLRDESDRQGMRVCIELRKDVNPNVILNQLFKHTQLQDTFGVIMLALVNNEPKVLNLLDMLKHYLRHQEDVVTRRTKYELNKAEERAHILQGLLIALDNIDEVIAIIRGSRTTQEAKTKLMERFGLTDAQSQAIVDMRLRALTGLEREKLEAEYKDLMARIAELKAILADEKKLLGVIKEEIMVISAKYGDDRRTSIGYDEYDISMEDLIPVTNTVIAMTKLGYIKRMSADNFRAQHRGGRGIKGMETIDDDYIEELFMTTSHHYLMFFTNTGKVYRMKAYEIPEASRTARGTAIINLLQLAPGEKITAVIPIKDYRDGWYLFISQAMSKIFSGIGTTVLGAVATASAVGIYSAIYKIPYIMVLFFSPISQALYPHISVRFSDSFENGCKTVVKAAKLVIPAFALAGFAIILLRKQLILIAFGKEYLEYSAIIIPLVLWMLFSVINNFMGIQFLVASGNQKLYSCAFTIGSLITVGLNVLLGLILGIYGVSAAAPIGEVSLTVLLYFGVKKAKQGGN